MQIPEGVIETRSAVFVSVSQLRSLEHKCFLNEGVLTASNNDGPETTVQGMADLFQEVLSFKMLVSCRN